MADSVLTALAAGPFLAGCSLLVIAGISKVHRPGPVRDAVAAAGLRVPASAGVGLGTTLGIAEIAAGVAGAVFAGVAALAVAIVYLALGAFAWRLLRRAPTTPCACLGSSSAPVSRVHVLVDLAAAAVAFAAAMGGSPFSRLAGRPFGSALFVVLVACCVKLGALVLETLPRLDDAMKEIPS